MKYTMPKPEYQKQCYDYTVTVMCQKMSQDNAPPSPTSGYHDNHKINRCQAIFP